MRTQAKPFVVEIKKRKRKGVGDSPAANFLGLVAEAGDVPDKPLQSRASDELFGRGGLRRRDDRNQHEGAGAEPNGGSPGSPAPAIDGPLPANGAARVLPDLSRHEPLENDEAEPAKPAQPARRKRRSARKPAEPKSRPLKVSQRKTSVPPTAPPPLLKRDESDDAQKQIRRARAKWSARRTRRGKADAGVPVPRLGERWKRHLPKTYG